MASSNNSRLLIEGGRPLHGTVRVGGSKNGADYVVAACLLTGEECILENVPDIDDVRMMAQILESLGYSKRGDGFLYDPAGRRLNIDLRIPLQNDIHAKTAAPVADYWHQLGVAVEQVGIPIQRATDREYRALYPAFEIVERRNSLQVSEMIRMHGSEVQLAEQRFRGSGTMRYRNAEHDALIERYATTIPMPDRMEALGRLVHHQTENLTHLPIFFGADPTLISNRLINVTARGDAFTQAWNVHEWDVQ